MGRTRPRDPFADQKGNVWFVGQVGNYIGRLDPKTGEFKRYEIEAGTHPHNLVVDAKGTVWFTGNANGRIVRLDPATGKLTTYMMPDPRRRARSAHDDLRPQRRRVVHRAERGRRRQAHDGRRQDPALEDGGRLASVRHRRRLEGSSLVRPVRHEQDRHDRSEVGRVPRVHAAERPRAPASHRHHERRRRSGTATTRAATSAGSIRRAARWTSGRSRRAGCRCRTR